MKIIFQLVILSWGGILFCFFVFLVGVTSFSQTQQKIHSLANVLWWQASSPRAPSDKPSSYNCQQGAEWKADKSVAEGHGCRIEHNLQPLKTMPVPHPHREEEQGAVAAAATKSGCSCSLCFWQHWRSPPQHLWECLWLLDASIRQPDPQNPQRHCSSLPPHASL